jgi:hypothetical protein
MRALHAPMSAAMNAPSYIELAVDAHQRSQRRTTHQQGSLDHHPGYRGRSAFRHPRRASALPHRPAELERVYGKLGSPDARSDEPPDEMRQSASVEAMRAAGLEREVALLRETLEHDRRSFEEERTFLRGMLEKQAEQVRLLTDQREQKPHSPSLLAWLFRKKS